MNRYLGIDVGAETIKVVELSEDHGKLRWTDRLITEHGKDPAGRLSSVLTEVDWQGLTGAAVSGRLSRQLNLPRIPTKQAQARAYRFLHGPGEATVVSIGSHGFSVLELRSSGLDVFRENSRCSQGTGNFLRQLVERFDLTIDEASALSAEVADPAPLSGRCPVILKTDMTHLANKGTDRSRILAGLYDAVCENVQVQIKPRLSPPRTVLIGGVCRSPRIRENFRRFLDRHAMTLTDERADDGLFYEALGSALIATESAARLPSLERLIVPTQAAHLDRLPGLAEALPRVRRMAAPASRASSDAARQLILGFDIGSTGSKLVALDVRSGEPVFETYVRTGGDPVGASMALMRQYTQRPATADRVVGLGVTGSGREIVGSLMTICYGAGSVFIMNEIAAHAEGAVRYDPRVDTIFEIGGQDAKYIRLAAGRVVDAAMNEACSAGTGSFIEEQGRKLGCASDAAELGAEALAAPSGVSLGQHCSVFMAEIIDEAVAAGVRRGSIIAGIYDSVVQNYLNRVKGSRTIGSVIFCQGMPFAADALAAAVARQTGSEVIVPPSPGTVGALGIALLATRHLTGLSAPLAPTLFLEARVDRRDTFVCGSTSGCGGAGNRCRIDRLTTRVAGQSRQFTWGGGCSLYDKGARGRKLPPRTPDPFRERREAIEEIARRTSVPRGLPRIALTESFQLKGQFPFFATFLHRLGFDLDVITGGDQPALKRGIEEAHVPFCAPMQQFHGLVGSLADLDPDYIFLPMVRSTPRMADEDDSVLCPIVQGSPDLLRLDLGPAGAKVISPVIDMGKGNLTSSNFIASCRGLAASLGVKDERWQEAYRHAVQEQTRFDREFLERGRAALEFAKSHGLVAVVVLGRNYTIHNTVLNSNVPSILREQGALPVPVDCFPVTDDQPVFYDMYWGYGQRILRAAEQIRATPGLYSVFCSNYSCGPDSFTQHFYAHAMEGKPFVVIETDGHSGDAGTKTRIEAFLHCVDEHRAARPRTGPTTSLQQLEMDQRSVQEIRQNGERVLIPWMGPGSEVLAASLRGAGFLAETLPMPTRETLTIGRRHTSGKECLPMCVTAGSVLERIEREPDSADRYAFFMPRANGPCRFGMYNLLHKIVLHRLGHGKRVRVFAPHSDSYFEGISQGLAVQVFIGFMASDLLIACLHHARPVETRRGVAQELFDRYHDRLTDHLESQARRDASLVGALLEVASGRLFGLVHLLSKAAAEFAAIVSDRELPTVLVTGEMYVRCDEFSNDFTIRKLEERGIRTRLSPFNEWLEYVDRWNVEEGRRGGFGAQISSAIQRRIQRLTYQAVQKRLGWPARTTVKESVAAAAPYIRRALGGEAVLTLGGAVHEWREGVIDGVVSIGPLECMPNKIAESQFFHVAEQEGLLSLTLPLNGDPIDPEVLDTFAFEVHARCRARQAAAAVGQQTGKLHGV